MSIISYCSIPWLFKSMKLCCFKTAHVSFFDKVCAHFRQRRTLSWDNSAREFSPREKTHRWSWNPTSCFCYIPSELPYVRERPKDSCYVWYCMPKRIGTLWTVAACTTTRWWLYLISLPSIQPVLQSNLTNGRRGDWGYIRTIPKKGSYVDSILIPSRGQNATIPL